jgi:hypothetical protein
MKTLRGIINKTEVNMEIFKKSILNSIIILCLLISCKDESTTKNNKHNDTIITTDTLHITEELRKISADFINTYNINNSIIEVAINKKEPDEIYISLTCKGVAYFVVSKLSPSFTYELKNNTFFVFTGAEEMLQIPFDEAKYKNRKQERCDSIIKSCYIFQDNKIQKEENCSFPDPFSSMPPPSLPKK